jgi:cytochrome c biogenesis protein CcdA
MDFSLATYGLGAAAGLLSTLSPCVLPLLPILIGSAVATHPRAPWALAAGLALSYGVVGTVLASAGSLLGLSPGLLRGVSAGLLAVLGAVLLVEPLQQRFAAGLAGVGNAGQQWLQRLSLTGLRGQFVVGLLLGLVWSPCVGPTLGAAVVLAAQGQQLAQVAALMGLFGVGAALPVVLLGKC